MTPRLYLYLRGIPLPIVANSTAQVGSQFGGKGGPSQGKTGSSGMYHEHWRRIHPSSLEPNPLIGLSPPPVLKSAT